MGQENTPHSFTSPLFPFGQKEQGKEKVMAKDRGRRGWSFWVKTIDLFPLFEAVTEYLHSTQVVITTFDAR